MDDIAQEIRGLLVDRKRLHLKDNLDDAVHDREDEVEGSKPGDREAGPLESEELA